MEDKFFEHFAIIGREELKDNSCAWIDNQQAITSVSFAQQPNVQATLANVNWDLVIVDEAHHMAGYEDRATLAYALGQILSRQCTHLILATATPHKGNRENFLKLLQLLDPGIYDADIVRHGNAKSRGSSLMLRRLKEEMVDFQGEPLFKPRIVETHPHVIGDNPPEMALYSALTDYVSKTYKAAQRLSARERVNVQFAMVFLQRRMASSLSALQQSLINRRQALLTDQPIPVQEPAFDYDEDTPENERWQVENNLVAASAARSKQEREKEASEIASLLSRVDAVLTSGRQTKVDALVQVMADAGVNPTNGEKLLVFTEFLDTLNELRQRFEKWGYKVTQIDGTMPQDKRLVAEAEFASEHCQVMVATEAAGEGINLQFCSHMINYDLPWVPTRLEQRMGRIHRYGQKRIAYVYNLVAADTREGQVLVGLFKRLDEMRATLGDQVFDVVSALIADADMQHKLNEVALSPATEDSQRDALHTLLDAAQRGEAQLIEWQEHPHPLNPERYTDLMHASRQSRLTPEYAQHFFVDTLRLLKEKPTAEGGSAQDAGDADTLRLELLRPTVAQRLGLRVSQPVRLTFQQSVASSIRGVRLVTLGTPVFEGTLALAQDQWQASLLRGALFLDLDLLPGMAYLLWFLRATAYDGLAHQVTQTIFAVRQTDNNLCSAAASSLVDLIPNSQPALVPQWLQGLVRDPEPALHWSIVQQQLPFLTETRVVRVQTVNLRREATSLDALAGLHEAQQAYNNTVFGISEEDPMLTEQRLNDAKRRVCQVQWQYEHEASCWLGRPEIVAVAAVLPLSDTPPDEMPDQKHAIETAAMRCAASYEVTRGRQPIDVTGEHEHYPYDLHSTGPGGPRCIEVKGTTTGRVFLSENERRAGLRLGNAYYLYIVADPLGTARLSIIRDPLHKLNASVVLPGNVRYGYDASAWRAAADEEI